MWCLTVRQPFASLILGGLKTAEYRSWRCRVSSIGIHSARAYPAWSDIEIAATLLPAPVDLDALMRWAMAQPRGFLLGSVAVSGCSPTAPASPWRPFGAWAWQLSSPRWWDLPVRARGSLGLWRFSGARPAPSLF